jgi:hypothetical protein
MVANHKLSTCSASNGNLHESPVKNLLNPFLEEKEIVMPRILAHYIWLT